MCDIRISIRRCGWRYSSFFILIFPIQKAQSYKPNRASNKSKNSQVNMYVLRKLEHLISSDNRFPETNLIFINPFVTPKKFYPFINVSIVHITSDFIYKIVKCWKSFVIYKRGTQFFLAFFFHRSFVCLKGVDFRVCFKEGV